MNTIQDLLKELGPVLGGQHVSFNLRSMSTKWASISRNDLRIHFNPQLVTRTPRALRYLVICELLRIHKEYGGRDWFWERLKTVCPDWEQAHKELNDRVAEAS